MYSNARSCVWVDDQCSEEFGVRVVVHLGSVLSPLHFILVLEALSHKFRIGVPWELLYADDRMLIANTHKEYISKLKVWKAVMENKGLCVNMKKNKFMVSGVGLDVQIKSNKSPCDVCCKGVGNNSARCSLVDRWPMTTTSAPGVMAILRPSTADQWLKWMSKGTKLDVKATFCYLGDMMCSGGRCQIGCSS